VGQRVTWIVVLVHPDLGGSYAAWRLAQVAGAQLAARWERERRTMSPGGLKRKLRAQQN
jgi:hypothetical protein